MKANGFPIAAVCAAIASILLAACADPGAKAREASTPPRLQAVSEDADISIDERSLSATPLWPVSGHRSVARIAASQWGLSSGRAAVVSDASDDPDVYQSGIDNGYNQQWSHAYIYDRWFGTSYYLWGDADDDFKDNLDGPLGGEGYDGKYAGYWYAAGSQASGDKWLGIALHFIEDVSLTLHSTAPTSMGVTVPMVTVDMLPYHTAFESWVDANLAAGHRLLDAVDEDYYYYAITDPKAAIRNAAWASCSYKGTSSVGYSAWKAYRDSGYPTGAGTGTAALVTNTKKMLVAAGRYAKGAIKYALDKYGQWDSAY
jgi:hypothetical protein